MGKSVRSVGDVEVGFEEGVGFVEDVMEERRSSMLIAVFYQNFVSLVWVQFLGG